MLLRALTLLALLPYAGWLALHYRYHVLDHVNLAVHEAGHVLFTPFGMTAHMLGGTVLQLAAPLAFVIAFVLKGRRFDAAVCGLWFAESLMYTAEYLGDAYLMQLPRVGGNIHDWNWLLSKVGLVRECESIATGVHTVATVLAFSSLAWAAYVTWLTPSTTAASAGAHADDYASAATGPDAH